MLLLSFDTATDVATCALLDGSRLLGERTSTARLLLEDVDDLLSDAGREPQQIEALVVGTGPGSFTSTRIGLAIARGIGLGLEIPAAGVSTLAALGIAGDSVYPIVDARRREVFVAGPRVVGPDELRIAAGTVCIGNGAVRYRSTLERMGAVVPPDNDDVHLPHARLHARLATEFRPADVLDPVYVRMPDAKEPRA